MSDMLFNVCLFRWRTTRGTWRFRLGWFLPNAAWGGSWHRVLGTRLAWTWFFIPSWRESS